MSGIGGGGTSEFKNKIASLSDHLEKFESIVRENARLRDLLKEAGEVVKAWTTRFGPLLEKIDEALK